VIHSFGETKKPAEHSENE